MQIGPFITLVSSTFGVPERSVTQVARALREAGWLTTGARGVNAPDMAMRDAARLSLALLTGEPPSRVVDEFTLVRTLQTEKEYPTVGLLTRQELPKDHNLEDAITELFVFSFNPTRVLEHSRIFLGSTIKPSLSVSLDSSRRLGRVDTPEVTAAFYTDLKGQAELDELWKVRPLTSEAWQRIQELEGRSQSSEVSSEVVSGRGMRVVRTITEEEILAIGERMRPPK